MPFIQTNVPQQRKLNTFSLKNFNGGLNNFSNIIADNEASDLLNVSFTDESLIEKRKGIELYSDFEPINSESDITFVDEYVPYIGDSQLIAATDSEFYFFLEDNQNNVNINGKISGSNYMGKYFFTDGYNIRVYGEVPSEEDNHTVLIGTPVINRTVFTLVEQPIVIGSFEKIAPNSYKLVLPNTTKNFELCSRLVYNSEIQMTKGSNKISAILNSISVVGDNLEIALSSVTDVLPTSLISSNSSVSTFSIDGYILQHKAIEFESIKSTVQGDANSNPALYGKTYYNFNDNTVWYEPCVLELTDTTRGSNVFPSTVKFVKSHNGRLFYAGNTNQNLDDTIFISEVNNPFYFPYYAQMQLTPTGDSVVGISVYHNSVIVGRETDVHAIYGSTNDVNAGVSVFQIKKINTHTGFASNNAITQMQNHLVFLGSDGVVYAMSSVKSDVDLLTTQILSRKLDLFKAPIGVGLEELSSASMMFNNDILYVSIGDVVLVYYYRFMAWSIYRFSNKSVSFLYTTHLMKTELFVSNKICTFSEDFMDLDRHYYSKWKSKQFDMGTSVDFKQFREFFLVFGVYKDYNSTINATFEIDYNDVGGTFASTSKLSVFGKSSFGDKFINRNITSSNPITIGQRGRTMSIVVYNGYEHGNDVENLSGLSGYIGAKEGLVVFVKNATLPDNSYTKYFLFTKFNWVQVKKDDLNQPFKLYEINGQYQFRGKR